MRPELKALHVADPPERWKALGFKVHGGACDLGGIRLRFDAGGHGIVGWSLAGIGSAISDIDGLITETPPEAIAQLTSDEIGGTARHESEPFVHPNGAIGIDHVVVLTPDFDRTTAALERAGMPIRRVREVPASGDRSAFRQGFRRLGPAILELVETDGRSDRDASFWGLVVVVRDLQALGGRLGDRLGPARNAVQPGRRIATLRTSAGLGEAVAFMTPER